MSSEQPDNAGVIAPPPLLYAGPLLGGLLLHLIFPRKALPNSIARPLGALGTVAGLFLASTAFQQLRQAKTNISPTQPVTAIVTSGPYRITRNPIYLALTVFYLGVSLLVNSAWPLFFLPIVLNIMNRGVIDCEEYYLERKFGAEYMDYKTYVNRWL